jgi:hypothetical protein
MQRQPMSEPPSDSQPSPNNRAHTLYTALQERDEFSAFSMEPNPVNGHFHTPPLHEP